MFLFLGLVGVWPGGAPHPINPETHPAGNWPALGLILLLVLAVPGWLVSRSRLAPRRPATVEEELAGHTAAMLALGVVALLVVATNAFALLFLLPSLHIWLWLPQVRDRGPGAQARPARRRPARAVHPRRLVHVPLRARPRCALVPCGTRRDRLRIDCGLPARPLLAGRGRAADRARGRPLRAVPDRRRAAAARSDPEQHPRDRAHRALRGTRATAEDDEALEL